MSNENDSNKIACDIHGKHEPAYICRHLQEEPTQDWFSDLPTQGNVRPDAWCARCDAIFQKNGGWNDNSDEQPDIAVVCEYCYDSLRSKSVEPGMQRVLPEWQTFASQCSSELAFKQESLIEKYKLNEHQRWDWELDELILKFSNDGNLSVVAEIEFFGSTSTKSDTWLWGWGNSSLADVTKAISPQLITFGNEHDFLNMTVPCWPGDEVDGWEMTAVAVHVLGMKGAYRTSSDSGFAYVGIKDIHWVD